MSFACIKNSLITALIIFTSTSILSITATQVFAAPAKKSVPAKKPAVRNPTADMPSPVKPSEAKPDVKPVEFLFMPPDGITFIESYKETSIVGVNGIKLIPEVIEWKSKISIKRIPDGYKVTRTPISYKETDIKEQTFNTVYSKCLKSAPLEYELELNGDCIKVHGIDKVVEAIIEEINKLYDTDEEPDERIRAGMAEMLAMIEKNIWNSKYTQLLGLVIKPGERIKNSTEIPVFYGILVPGTTEFQVLSTQKFNGRDCAKVQTHSYTNSTKPEKDVMGYLKFRFSYLDSFKEDGISITNFSSSFRSESIIEPATMLIHSETSKKSSKLEILNSIGVKTTIIADEYSQFYYEYEKQPEGQ